MAFNESRLLDSVAYGSEFGHQYNTRIVSLRSGHERRNAEWSLPLGRYSVLYQNLLEDDHALVLAAHHACQGMLTGFRFKDWADFEATAEVIGVSDGTPQDFQLTKTYTFGSLSTVKNITKPVVGQVQVYSNGVPISSVVDYVTGIVTVTGIDTETLTWTGEFDTPVRFDSDEISFSADNRSPGSLILTSNVSLTEVRI